MSHKDQKRQALTEAHKAHGEHIAKQAELHKQLGEIIEHPSPSRKHAEQAHEIVEKMQPAPGGLDVAHSQAWLDAHKEDDK